VLFIDQRLSIWDLQTGRERLNVTLEGVGVPNAVAFSPDGNQIAVVNNLGGAFLLDARPLPPKP
jgi:Tol biopolymer transport system component